MTAKLEICEGKCPNGHPYLKFGDGAPLIALPGSTPENGNLDGGSRKFMIKPFLPLAAHRTVYVFNRRPGVPVGLTMADIATDLAEGLTGEFDSAVDVVGYSTGGSVALQLAHDHPAAVRRLVLASAAYSLSTEGRNAMRLFAERAAAGKRPAVAWASIASTSPLGRRLMAGFLWMIDPMMRPSNGDYTEAIRVIEAEDSFDLRDRLADIATPTVVIGGDKDLAYPVAMFRDTAEGLKDAELLVYAGRNHNSAIADRRFVEDVLEFLER
ncbi:alpha/beta fold hydrolase [Nocardia sputi]|uniref:alpha/beta fold hydrolase n=1 Tax=Nocardia sputi TaxID=2943705 RepID=UPI0020BE8831|nr:alpha/beta hydrolase [Nocardia sputi]